MEMFSLMPYSDVYIMYIYIFIICITYYNNDNNYLYIVVSICTYRYYTIMWHCVYIIGYSLLVQHTLVTIDSLNYLHTETNMFTIIYIDNIVNETNPTILW